MTKKKIPEETEPPIFPPDEIYKLAQSLIEVMDTEDYRIWVCLQPKNDHPDYFQYAWVQGSIPTEVYAEVKAEAANMESMFNKVIGTASEINWGFGDSRDDYGIWQGPTTYTPQTPETKQADEEMISGIKSPTIRNRFLSLWAALNTASITSFIGMEIDNHRYSFSLMLTDACFKMMVDTFGNHSEKVN
jgi:hypothetical protein